MPKVHLLEDELINKIAAGEVVDRPASVVKELVENAVDAGASFVEVELIDGGRQLILVRDNGSGMSCEDAALAVQRHCTSKISSVDDLFSVGSMGFRGEALAAIAAVSDFTLQTRQAADEAGSQLKIAQGRTQKGAWNGPVGTSIAVAELFSTIPARKAFMKTAAAEFAACHEYIHALALSKPEVGFRLRHNDKIQLDIAAATSATGASWGEAVMKERWQGIFGRPDESMLYLERADKFGSVEALISPPGFEKSSGKAIFTFVNKRWVKDKTLRYAVLRGYHSHLLKGKFPVCFLNFTVDPGLIDVNVHPAKAELRFQYARETQNLIATAIKERLRSGDWASHKIFGASAAAAPGPVASPESPASKPLPDYIPGAYQAPSVEDDLHMLSSTVPKGGSRGPKTSYYQSRDNKSKIMSFAEGSELPSAPSSESRQRDHSTIQDLFELDLQGDRSSPSLAAQQVPQDSERAQLPWAEMQFLGAFQKCYLLFSWQENLLALDQHAFHERILYERLSTDQSLLRQSQKLLVPEILDCNASDLAAVLENKAALADLGFTIESISSTELELRSVPSLLKDASFESLIPTLARQLDSVDMGAELTHDILSTLACHSAVRAGEELPENELQVLLSAAESVDFYHNCPHGRRVLKVFSTRDVEKWFDR